jgi:hypothetical protein
VTHPFWLDGKARWPTSDSVAQMFSPEAHIPLLSEGLRRTNPRGRFYPDVKDQKNIYLPWCLAALAIDGPALAKSSAVMTGRRETFASNARNQGSATAATCDSS